MALTPVELTSFGGLDLKTDPQDLAFGGAIDMADVELSHTGTLRTRDGYTKWTSSAAASRYGRLFSFPTIGTNQLIAQLDLKLQAFNYDGTSTTSSTLTAGVQSMAAIGGSSQYVYAPVGDADGHLTRWDGSAFAYPNVGYHAQWIATQPLDNRLVLAGEYNVASLSQCRVQFSDAGAPETFSGNYVDLSPNDGQYINGAVTWGTDLYVFKDSKFYVFYGNGELSDGSPVFNYRTVDTGVGIPYFFQGCCVATPRGVYFIGSDGVYLTTGGAPVKVSKQVDPLFRENDLPYYFSNGGGAAINRNGNPQGARMAWLHDRLYVAVATAASSSNTHLLVLDPDVGWMRWTIKAAGLAPWFANTSTLGVSTDLSFDRMYFSFATGTNDIGVISPYATTDNGAAISGSYMTGFWNPGAPGGESTIREWLVDGTGSVSFKAYINDGVPQSFTNTTLTLGTAGETPDQARDRRAVHCRNVGIQISGSAPWQVNRVVAMVRDRRAPGLKAA